MSLFNLKNITQDLNLDKNSLIIFDIDSTIYNVSPRTQKIVNEFCQLESSLKIDIEACKTLLNIKIEACDWGFEEALIRENFKSYFEFIRELTGYWRKHFFSNHYLKYDIIYPGAADYIRSLSDKVSIKYLTGRSVHSMLEGTWEQLKKDLLPLNSKNDLILKKQGEPDHIYKLKEVKNLMDSYNKIVVFENEPVIINHLNESIKDMPLVFINSTHSRKATLTKKYPIIEMDYRPFLSTHL